MGSYLFWIGSYVQPKYKLLAWNIYLSYAKEPFAKKQAIIRSFRIFIGQ